MLDIWGKQQQQKNGFDKRIKHCGQRKFEQTRRKTRWKVREQDGGMEKEKEGRHSAKIRS